MPRFLVLANSGRTVRLLYTRILAARPTRRVVFAGGLAASLTLLPACGALRLGEAADPIVTGSINPMSTGTIKPQLVALTVPAGDAPDGISGGDWAQAKLALDQALASPDKAASIPWDNPRTGARGTATPIGGTGSDGCREFRIGLVDTSGEHWVQGSACKDGKGAVTLNQVRVLGRA